MFCLCFSAFLQLTYLQEYRPTYLLPTVWPMTFWPSIAFLISSPSLISSTAE